MDSASWLLGCISFPPLENKPAKGYLPRDTGTSKQWSLPTQAGTIAAVASWEAFSGSECSDDAGGATARFLTGLEIVIPRWHGGGDWTIFKRGIGQRYVMTVQYEQHPEYLSYRPAMCSTDAWGTDTSRSSADMNSQGWEKDGAESDLSLSVTNYGVSLTKVPGPSPPRDTFPAVRISAGNARRER